MTRVLSVRLLDAIARLLRTAADSVEHRATLIYRAHSKAEARKAAQAEVTRMMDQQRRDALAAEDLIAETRPAKRVGSPIHRDR